MQRKMRVVLAFALVVAMVSASRASADVPAGPAAASCKALTASAGTPQVAGELDGFLANIAPAGEQKASCPAPFCVTNHDCVIRPPGDAKSTCEYGRVGTPPGCGYCFY